MSAPRQPRSRTARTAAQRWELKAGPHWRSSEFESEEDQREAWFRARDEMLSLSHAGRRPWAWWRWESPQPRNSAVGEERQLFELGELTAREIAVLEPEWRKQYERGWHPEFFHCEGPGRFLEGAAGRSAHLKWAGVPREFIKRWDAERARRSRVIKKLARVPK